MTEFKALLLTDIVDSTKLAERFGDEVMAMAWGNHDRVARDLLPRWRGREIDKTDGMLLLFDSALDAACYALEYHRALQSLSVPLKARAGLHVGEVSLHKNSAADISRGAKQLEVEGIAKPIAARIMSAAMGGQTLLSAQARTAMGQAPLRFHSHGYWRMKGVAEPVELYEVGDDSSPWQPPPGGSKIYRVVADGDIWRPLVEVRHNLPRERDEFVGRASDLVALARQVDEGVAILTLLGAAGSGKTRLARRFGRSWLGEFPGGVWFCDLSAARSIEGIASAVAAALDVPLGKGDPVVQLGHAIAGRGRCLVILDNFEQLTAHAHASLGQWADRADDAVFLVTSRERLRLAGEQVHAVEPLSEDPAIALFEARAKAQDHKFTVNKANCDDVAAIVRTLDCIPLAIELAAARISVLPPEELRERLRDRFQVLAGVRGRVARQATLLAAIDWSWDLLAPWEKSALAQCSVFVGGFTLAAAEAVLDLSAFREAPPVVDVVQALVDKSLVRGEAARRGSNQPYFGMYVSIHEYAQERLCAPNAFPGSGPAGQEGAWTRHVDYYAKFGTDEAIEALDLHGGVERRRKYALELENLIAACQRAIARGDGDRAAAALCAAWVVFELQGPYGIAISLGREALGCFGLTDNGRARVLSYSGRACWLAGRMADSREHHEQALAIYRDIGDRRCEGKAIGDLGHLHEVQGRIVEARDHYERALAIHREVGNRRAEAAGLGPLGNLCFTQGRIAEAQALYERALAIHREVGNRRAEGMVLGNLGGLHQLQGRLNQAREYYELALEIQREVGARRFEGVVLGNLGGLHKDQGRIDDALEHYRQALAIQRDVGARSSEGLVLGNLGVLHMEQGRLDEARAHFERALAIDREVGFRLAEGVVLGKLGSLYAKSGATAEARSAFAEGERCLREMGDKAEIGNLLCARGEMEAQIGDVTAARGLLNEALELAAGIGAGPESELGKAASNLSQLLGQTRPGAAAAELVLAEGHARVSVG